MAMMRKGNGNVGIGRRSLRNSLNFAAPPLPDECVNE